MPWIVDETNTSAEFTAQVGYNYKFYSIVTDNVSWIEDTPDDYDTETDVLVGIEELENPDANLLVFPNPAKGKVYLKMENTSGIDYQIVMYDINGKTLYNDYIPADKLASGISLDLSMCGSGIYMLKVISENYTYSKKLIVR